MTDELHEIWRDDRLIEAAAGGDLHHTVGPSDAAVAPLCALAQVADARPLPRLDVDPAELVAAPHSHRYAVRSLAVAVAVVATLSTSGVSAVVTGDPFRPATAFWHEIQDHTVVRSDTGAGGLGSGAAVGAPEHAQPVARAQETAREVAPVVSHAAGRNGQTAHAPSQAPEEPRAAAPAPGDTATDETEQPDDTAASPRAATAEDESAAPEESPAQDSTQEEPQQEPTQEQQGDEEPDAEQQPAPEEDSDDDELDPLVLPRQPGDDEDPVQSEPAQRAGSDDDGAQQPLLSEPATSPAPGGAADGAAAQEPLG